MRDPNTRGLPAHVGAPPNISQELRETAEFALSLSRKFDSPDYLQAEFHYYDRKYNISKYGKQLPICLVMAGKNNANVVLRAYESIRRQNYSNFRIAHLDDNSDDDTQNTIANYLQNHTDMRDRTTFVIQHFQRGVSWNRHYACSLICQDGDVIIDLDTDDYLIGNQAFQLANAVYQAGNQVDGKNEEIWGLWMNFLVFGGEYPKPLVYGPVDKKYIQTSLSYRVSSPFRTSHLRTYLRKIYDKVDIRDFVDPAHAMKG